MSRPLVALLALLCVPAPAAGEGPASWAWDVPEAPPAVDGECPAWVELVPGQPLPPGLVVDGVVTCGGTVVPNSDVDYLLTAEAWAQRAAPRGARLVLELGWERDRAAILAEPPPWHQRPRTQRALGRVEGLVTVGLAAWVLRQSLAAPTP